MRDVASLAGVSYQTVSRVVNRHPNVASETRERVLRAIDELNYRPNWAAQALTTGRSHILHLIIFQFGYGYPVPAMFDWAREFGYTMTVTELKEPITEAKVREVLGGAAWMIDGLLLVMPFPYLSYGVLTELCQGHPFVFVGIELGAQLPSVVFDQRHGTRQAVQHLLDLGHCQIAEISGPRDNLDARVRHETFVALLEERGIEPGPKAEGDFFAPSGYAAAIRLLDSGKPFSAIFVANDPMALGAMRALHEHGIRVPEDVSVVGFDDILESAYFEPPLTTVRQDFRALGKQSVEYLVSLIEEPDTPVHQRVLYPELVVRQSTRRIHPIETQVKEVH